MRYGTLCEIGEWHPEAATCSLPSCQLRGVTDREDDAASLNSRAASCPTPVPADGPPCAVGGKGDERSRYGQADRLGRGAESVAVHAVTYDAGSPARS